jgi:hypothetical protein
MIRHVQHMLIRITNYTIKLAVEQQRIDDQSISGRIRIRRRRRRREIN